MSGGTGNRASSPSCTVGGGLGNFAGVEFPVILDEGYATVPGGRQNQAGGDYSFAAGRRAKVRNPTQAGDSSGDQGTFVWADSTNADFISSGDDQFLIRATGGVGINTNSPTDPLTVNGVIRSVTGGIKFPDGTIQTTAAAGGGNTLDEAYDEGGPGAGRTITADAGAVDIAGPDGLTVEGTITAGSTITIDGTSGSENVTSSNSLELHVAAGRALRLETNATSPNVIGGFSGNSVTAGASGATIGGGGESASANTVTDTHGTIGGGRGNTAGSRATVAGGRSNTATATESFIGGGNNNTASVGGIATIGGGQLNTASGATSTVCGGNTNTASGDGSVVGGGGGNMASGLRATVPGGLFNTASGEHSFAAGRQASAAHNGTFVWADDTAASFSSTATNQFLIRASGGVGIGRTTLTNQLEVEGEASKTVAGGWLANSDARIKTDTQTVTHALETLDKVRLVEFRYTDEYLAAHPAIKDRPYLNIIAQEFAEVFPDHVKSGGDVLPDGSKVLQADTYPLTIYSAAAVQELHRMLIEKECELEVLRQKAETIESLEARLQALEARLGGQVTHP